MFWSILFACLGKIPSYLIDPIQYPHANCPTDSHLIAVGFDDSSPAMAQENARRRVAERVSSSISTQQESMNAVSQVNGVESVEKRLEQQSRVTAEFQYYNLIGDVGAPHRSKDGYRALACLSLEEWEQEVMQTTQSSRERLQSQARELSQTSDVFVFGIQQYRFYEEYVELSPTIETLRAVLNRPSMLEMELDTVISLVERHNEEMRQQTPIFLLDSSAPPQTKTGFAEKLQAGGLQIQDGKCTGAQGIEVQLTSNQRHSKGPMGGEVAQITVNAALKSCLTGEEKTYNIVESQGYHSNNRDLAVKKAVDGLETFELPNELVWFLPMRY